MKIKLGDLDIEISDWTPKLKIAAVIFSAATVLSVGITLFFRYTVPGFTPIAFGIVMLLLGVRQFNSHFKVHKDMLTLTLGIICTLIFVFCLYIGIDQILTAVTKQIGL